MKHARLVATTLVALVAACSAEPGEPYDDADGRTIIRTEDGEFSVGYQIVEGRALVGGDIDIGAAEDIPDGDIVPRANVHLFGGLWPGGVVRYQLPFWFPARATIVAAIQEMDALTDLTFVEGTGPNYIQFQATGGNINSSEVGMAGGAQLLRLSWSLMAGATSSAAEQEKLHFVVQHELGHAVGLWHEQQRPDRDTFVNVVWPCLQSGFHFTFDKVGLAIGPYDYASFMHYSDEILSIAPGSCPTMTRSNGAPLGVGSVRPISARDIAGINWLY